MHSARSRDFFFFSRKKSIAKLRREFRGIRILVKESAECRRSNGRVSLAPKEGDKEVIALAQGFGATPHPYYKVAYELHKATGLGVVHPPVAKNILNMNVGSITRARKLIVDYLNWLATCGIKRVYWVGHSLGGVHGVLAKRSPDVKLEIAHVFTVASPVNDTTWKLLQIFAEVCFIAESPLWDVPRGVCQVVKELAQGGSPRLLPKELLAMRDNLCDKGGEFTTISLRWPNDVIAPEFRCGIQGGENIILHGNIAGMPRSYLSHAACVLHPAVIGIIGSGIRERQRRAKVRAA